MTNEEKMAKAVAQEAEGFKLRIAGERYTKFLEMYLPGENNYYRVEEDQNQNFEKIDGALENAQRMAIDLFSKKQDKEDNNLATTAKTVVGAINESKAYTDGLAGLQVGNSFPLSQATEGKVYKEPNSKRYYVCVKDYNGGLISVPNGNFEELSVCNNRKKLKNLIQHQGEENFSIRFGYATTNDGKGGLVSVTYDIPFETSTLAVLVCDDAAPDDLRMIAVNSETYTKTGFEAAYEPKKQAYTFVYIAIGN